MIMDNKIITQFINKQLVEKKAIFFTDLIEYESKIKSLIQRYKEFDPQREIEDASDYIGLMKDEISLLKLLDKLLSRLKEMLNKDETQKQILKSEVKKLISLNEYEKIRNHDFMKKLDFSGVYYYKSILSNKIDIQESVNDRKIKLFKEVINYLRYKKEIEKEYPEINSLTLNKFNEFVASLKNEIIKTYQDKNEVIVYNSSKVIVETVESVSNLLNLLSKIHVKSNETLFFRGQSSAKWNLIPSIYREGWIHKECTIFNELIIKHPEEFINCSSTFEKLTKMQHYGLPTRLLDVTYNPLVALYFACIDTHKMGEFFIFRLMNSEIKYYDSDTVSIISNITKLRSEFNLKNLLKDANGDNVKFNANLEVEKLIHEIRADKPYFQNKIIPSDMKKTIFVKCKLNNERIKSQRGAFILFGIGDNKFECSQIKEQYTKNRKQLKVLVPEKAKENILTELRLIGIHQSTLFPEISNTANLIKNEYR